MNTPILIVENEANIADDVETGLREQGYAVEHAADAVSGWLHLQAISRELYCPCLSNSESRPLGGQLDPSQVHVGRDVKNRAVFARPAVGRPLAGGEGPQVGAVRSEDQYAAGPVANRLPA